MSRSAQRRQQLRPRLLQRPIEGRPIAATSLGQVGASATAAAASLGHRADKGTSLGARHDHRLAKGRHQDHLGQIGRIGQTAKHHGSAIAELIGQALGRALQAGALHGGMCAGAGMALRICPATRLCADGAGGVEF